MRKEKERLENMQDWIDKYVKMNTTIMPFSKPLYVMTKPVGAVCNLACDYCYYLEKLNLYKDTSKYVMSDELLERFIKEYISSQTMPQVLFTWHGGETLMRPLSFYKRAVELQKQYAEGRTIDNCIQTNGTLLTDEWCQFFKENNWLVGVSIDGPQEFHDEYRHNKQGLPSFVKVMRGIELLDKHGVEWNAMAVVNDYNADYPVEFYNFFKSMGCHYIQFAPIVERIFKHNDGRHLALPMQAGDKLADFSVTPEQWGNFLCKLFDEWVKNDVGEYFIQIFDSTLANWVGEQPGVCSMAKTCGHAGVMEFNGDVYSCDHYVFPEYKLGNIYQNDQQVGTIGIVDFADYDYLAKYGENMYDLVNGGTVTAADGRIVQGTLESSNVNVVSEMVNMITISRAYQAGQKVINTIDETLDKAVNQVGNV